MTTTTYLGDSVYVEHDGYAFVLTTNNGHPDDPRNTIVLEPEVLVQFAEQIKRRPHEDQNQNR